MSLETRLGDADRAWRDEFRALAGRAVAPHADRADHEQHMPAEVIAELATAGCFAAMLPRDAGGRGLAPVAHGLLHEEIGRACSSARSLVTVQDMVALAIHRWGTDGQRQQWLPRLASGKTLAAFGLSEPNVGSDAKAVEAAATRDAGGYRLTGHKRWITGGAIAGVFLIVARAPEGLTAFLVERETAGLTTSPIVDLLGCRGSMLADVHLDGCHVSSDAIVGRPGFGFSHVAATALDLGRYTVAWGSVGIAQAALDASLAYARARKQFGEVIGSHQLVQRMITDMVAGTAAARQLCLAAAAERASGDPGAILQTTLAKYFAASNAVRAANDAVQIHGANGCSRDYPVQRYLRDARIMAIIEGSTEMQQTMIARMVLQELPA